MGRRLVLACGLIELFSWAALYYAVPLVMDPAARETGWSLTALTAGYSGALVLAALLSPWGGAVVDRWGPRHLVTGGVVVGGLGLAMAGAAEHPVAGVASMVLLGLGQTATLYPPVFAALAIWFADRAASAVMVVSLFGGISSAVLVPVLAPLVQLYGWREAVWWVALLYVVITAPLAWVGLRAPWHAAEGTTSRDVGAVVRTHRFRAAQLSLLLAGVALYAVTLNLVPLAREQGHTYVLAAAAFGLVGAGQVVGRLFYLPLSRLGDDPARRTALLVGAAAVTVAALAVAPGVAGLMVAAAAAGAVRGMHTLNVTLGVADRWGLAGFGELSGRFHRPIGLAIAVSPFIGALLADALGGFQATALALAAVTAAGILAARAS